ncbi:MAG: class I SAM-dependent methyltransferase, partial [Brevundimonas sp.]|uniref:class I SAM-dependent methyltransferase n=1 Tax=Brevundimonas sp. TaxID=1871086 RepID=UPI002ABBAA2A
MKAGRDHWDSVYALRGEAEVSWFEAQPDGSVREILAACPERACGLVDVGGGVSRLPDALIADGFRDLTVVDLSPCALALAKNRLGADAATVSWIEADVTNWRPLRHYDVWHDRAVFHFLTTPVEQAAYVATLR